MPEMTAATALRTLQQAQAGLRKARSALRATRPSAGTTTAVPAALKVGWESLSQAHKLMGTIPIEAATEPVMTRQLAVERYATALLVRLRRLARNEPGALGEDDDDEDGELGE